MKMKARKIDTKTATTRVRHGNIIVVTEVRTTIREAVVDYEDILEACVVEPDDDHQDTPWEDCDGYEHELVRHPGDSPLGDHADYEKMRGYCWDQGWKCRAVITIDECDRFDRDLYKRLREQGCSKQVAEEVVAMDNRRRIDILKNWYENGWEWWQVSCDFNDDMEYTASCGGIDDEDYAEKDVKHDIAHEVASQLEKAGYTVINKPDRHLVPRTGYTPEGFKLKTKREIHRFDVDPEGMHYGEKDWQAKGGFGRWYETKGRPV